MTDATSSLLDGRTVRANARREKRRAEVLRLAVETFSERGYHRTRVADIIEAAQIARGTFYLYFDSKNAIFLELLDNLLAEFRRGVVGVDTEPGSAPVVQQLIETVSLILKTAASNAALTRIILREAVGLDADVDDKLSAFYDRLHSYLQRSLVNGQEMGLLRDMDTGVIASCILGSVRQVLYRGLVRGDAETFEVPKLAREIVMYNTVGLLRVR